MSVALHGNLTDFGIAEVFQLIGQQRKTGTLVVEGDAGAIFLAFDEGRVVRGGPDDARGEREPLGPQLVKSGYLTREQWADLQQESERSARPLTDLLLGAGLIEPATLDEVQHLLTKETVFDVMRRRSGDFNFVAEPVHHDSPPERLLGAEQILMDGLRMLDEWQTFSAAVPGDETVFRRVGQLGAARPGHIERVLQLVDGRLTVRRIIDLSRIGTFEATRALAELRQSGVIDIAEVPRKSRGRKARSGPRMPVLKLLRAALATALPFAALGALGVTALDRAEHGGGLPGTALPVRVVDEHGDRYERDRIRGALEVHFYEVGRYPEKLESLAGRVGTLSPERLGDYYYAVRGEEIVLLAPAQTRARAEANLNLD
ncbi:MAG: DUF4388 domain-containing protein [Myxococcota bacterium]